MPFSQRENGDAPLVKHNLAAALQQEILEGRLLPGQRIVEGTWARKFGVAQASVREAINILMKDGFATKRSGRSARVTLYSEQDVARLYEVRGALEGLAARLIVERKADLAPLRNALAQMKAANECGEMRRIIETDVNFHLVLCESSGNPILYEHVRRIVVPLFGFSLIRVLQSHQNADAWRSDFEYHRRILDLLEEGDPALAEQYIRYAMGKFASRAYAVWENKMRMVNGAAGSDTNRAPSATALE